MNTNNSQQDTITAGISGNYIVKIRDKDGNERMPFGEKPSKNLILDTFFQSIFLASDGVGYRYGINAMVLSCRVGDNNTPPNRTQTGIIGNTIETTHRSLTHIPTTNGSAVSVTRDFTFTLNNTGSPITYREAVVGCFNSNYGDMNITVSRFVFPQDVVVQNGEQLFIIYTLSIQLDYLSRNIPISLTGDGLDLTGYIRMEANNTSLGVDWVGDAEGLAPQPANIAFGKFADSSSVYYRAANSSTNNFSITNGSQNGNLSGDIDFSSTLFGVTFQGTPISSPNRVGFISSANSARVAYSNTTTLNSADYALQSTMQSATKLDPQYTDLGASIVIRYYFAPFTDSAARNTHSIALWGNNIPFNLTNNMSNIIYLRFTESNFTTLRTLALPANKPVIFALRWRFERR